MHNIFLDKEIRKLQNSCEVKREDLRLLFELITFLTLNGEITLYDAEQYTLKLFKIVDGERGS